jgi:hypothetical protein
MGRADGSLLRLLARLSNIDILVIDDRAMSALDARRALSRGHLKWASDCPCTILVHNGVMRMTEKAVRQSVSLSPRLAKQVGSMAKSRKLSKNRMLLELIENGIDAEKRKQQEFFALAERFRNEQDPEAANRLGDELGRMVFGG